MIHMHAVPAFFSPVHLADMPKMEYLTNSEVDQSGKYRAIHSHDDIVEISLVCAGQGIHNIGGQEFQSKPGDLVLYNAGILHQDLAAGAQSLRFFCCGVSGVQLDGLPPGCIVSGQAGYQMASGRYFPFLQSGFENVEHALIEKNPYAAGLAQGFLQALISIVRALDSLTRADDALPAPQPSLAEQIRQYIDRHYTQNVSLEELASLFHVSRFHVTHAFTKAFGVSPIQYRTRRRIGEAQSLLTSSDYSITYIAGAVGYDDPNRFSQVFTKVVGMPPSRYRDLSVRS